MPASIDYELTVIVPVYNAEEYLPRNLDSLVCQQTENVEILVVDDASPGNCAEIVARYRELGHDIHYVKHSDNLGLMHARMTGMREARGRFILHLDADDMLTANAFSEILRIIQDPAVDMITYSCKYGPSLDKMEPRWHNHPNAVLEGEEIRDSYFDRKMWWMLCSKVFSKELCLKAAQFWPGKDVHINSNEDLLLFVPLLFAAKKCVAVNSFDYLYFANPSSMTKNIYGDKARWEKVCSDMGYVRREILRYLNEIGRSDRIESMEESMHANFVWLENEGRKLPYDVYCQRMRFLWQHYSTPQAYKHLRDKDFGALCDIVGVQRTTRDNPKHLAFFSEHFGLGGAERVATILSRIFTQHGYQVTFFGDFPHQDTDYPYPSQVERVVLPRDRDQRHAAILKAIAERNIDACIFISHYYELMYYDILSCRSGGCIAIAMEHNTFFYPLHAHLPYLFAMRHKAYTAVHALVCLSDELACWWRAAGIATAVHIRNPLTFAPSDNTALSRAQRGNTLLYVNKLNVEKGVFFLPYIVYEIKKQIPDIVLTLLGRFHPNPGDEQLLLKSIVEYGLEKNFRILGHVSNVAEYYAQAAAFILPSRFEGAPMGILEAKAYGTPSVIFAMDYMDPAFRDEVEGCVSVPRENTFAFATEVVRLLTDDCRWTSLSRAAFDSLASFSDVEILSAWKRLLKAIIDNKVEEMFSYQNVTPGRTLKMVMQEFSHGMHYAGFTKK